MTNRITSTHLHVRGVRTNDDVRVALQALYDVFAQLDLGQASFEVTDSETADLFIKHLETVTVDIEALDAALAKAGDFHIVT